MLARFFEAGGPVMLLVFATWVVVLAGVLDRLSYAFGRAWRRPMGEVAALARHGSLEEARQRLRLERDRAARTTTRIDAVSQLATSVGLFGTVLGIARAFFARGSELALADPDALAAGLATALFTTVAGLVVFLFGQGFLIAWREWESFCERAVRDTVL